MSAPERIWAYTNMDGVVSDHLWTDTPDNGTLYLRADIAASQLAAKEAEITKVKASRVHQAQLRHAAEAERDRLAAAALDATRKCMAAWAAGEPAHRVKDMIDAIEKLQLLVDPLHREPS